MRGKSQCPWPHFVLLLSCGQVYLRVRTQWYFWYGLSPSWCSLTWRSTRWTYPFTRVHRFLSGARAPPRLPRAFVVSCGILAGSLSLACLYAGLRGRVFWSSSCTGICGSLRIRRLERSMLLLMVTKNVHSETYSVLIEWYTRDPAKRERFQQFAWKPCLQCFYCCGLLWLIDSVFGSMRILGDFSSARRPSHKSSTLCLHQVS